MKAKEREALTTWLQDPDTLLIRFDGRDFYQLKKYENIVVWERLDSCDVIREIRRLLPDRFNTAEAAKLVKEEIQSSPLFVCQRPVATSKPEVITPQGRLDLRTLEIKPVEDDMPIYWYANFHYLPNATWKDAHYFVQYAKSSLGVDLSAEVEQGNGKRKLLLQTLVYMVTELWGTKKAIVLLGPASSGKTVLLDFLRFVVGEKGYTALSLADISDRFRGALIDTARIILNDEIGAEIKNLDYVKKVISGEPIVVERKNGTPYTCHPHIKVCVAANALPEVKEQDGEGAFAKRLQILQFPCSIPPEAWIRDLPARIIAERDVIMSCAIRESVEFIDNPIFTDDIDGAKLLAQYQRENDSLKAFLNDPEKCKLGEKEICLAEDFRTAYHTYCEEEGIRTVKRNLNLLLQQYGIHQVRKRDDKYKNPRSHYQGISLV